METRTIGRIRQTVVGLVAVVSLLLMAAAPVAAHVHKASVAHQGADGGQVLANGQLHGPFVSGVSCGGDPAGYGLETAHHGPDAGTPGKADGDGCYMTTGGVLPRLDVASPVIR